MTVLIFKCFGVLYFRYFPTFPLKTLGKGEHKGEDL